MTHAKVAPRNTTADPLRIVVSLQDQRNEYQLLQAADARGTARRLGLTIEILDAEDNAVLQLQQLLRTIRADPPPRAVVVEPLTPSGMENVTQKILESGIGLVVLNSSLEWLGALRRRAPPGLPVVTVSSDQVEIGRIQGRQLKALLPRGGSVLYVHGPQSASAAQQRFAGVREVLTLSNVRLIVLDASQWSEAAAESAVQSWLRLKSSETTDIHVVAAQDDSMAMGARRAIQADAVLGRRLAELQFLGIDGLPAVGQRLVSHGQLTATVIMPPSTGPALELLARWKGAGGPASESALQLTALSYPELPDLARHVTPIPP